MPGPNVSGHMPGSNTPNHLSGDTCARLQSGDKSAGLHVGEKRGESVRLHTREEKRADCIVPYNPPVLSTVMSWAFPSEKPAIQSAYTIWGFCPRHADIQSARFIPLSDSGVPICKTGASDSDGAGMVDPRAVCGSCRYERAPLPALPNDHGGDAQIRTGVKALQASALPLGHVADEKAECLHPALDMRWSGQRARTRDPNLGKVVLYQLSHVRLQGDTIREWVCNCKHCFEKNCWGRMVPVLTERLPSSTACLL